MSTWRPTILARDVNGQPTHVKITFNRETTPEQKLATVEAYRRYFEARGWCSIAVRTVYLSKTWVIAITVLGSAAVSAAIGYLLAAWLQHWASVIPSIIVGFACSRVCVALLGRLGIGPIGGTKRCPEK